MDKLACFLATSWDSMVNLLVSWPEVSMAFLSASGQGAGLKYLLLTLLQTPSEHLFLLLLIVPLCVC